MLLSSKWFLPFSFPTKDLCAFSFPAYVLLAALLAALLAVLLAALLAVLLAVLIPSFI
jgi:hypothetical protein